VERLEAAGMVVLGRTHMVEFAYGGWGTNPMCGAPRNPWDDRTHRVAGGSSSGSAVAVAAGLAPAALGTDTGGSIRTPAAWCGIVGLKTSVGLIGRGGVVPLAPTHDSVGPMTRSVRDAALLLHILAGYDPRDPTTLTAPTVDVMRSIEGGAAGLQIGVLAERELFGVDPLIRKLYAQALAELSALGARLKEMRLPLPVEDYLTQGGDIMSVESYALLGTYVERHRDKVDPIIAGRILRGAGIAAADYYRVLEARRAAQAALADTMQALDAFVLPGSHLLPVPLEAVDESRPPNLFGRVVNYLDLASLCIPIGITESGLPAGLQIVVRKFDDAKALQIGRAFERQRDGLFHPPPAFP
jgi:aspartyl-tRNA(Asn)/glutamyl-tRNA(Gln) amidotransferase subunit A